MNDARKAAARYIAAWNERNVDKRRALVAETYTDDATYVDPARSGRGHDGISSMIAAVHEQFPPAYRFQLKGTVEAHHDRARFQWEAGGQPEAPLHFVGTDVIEIAADGRIRTVTGFTDVAPQH
jgi:hypothetical protein